MIKLILVDQNNSVVNAWKAVFAEYEGLVEIQKGDLFEAKCDAIVSPANSFGFMDGGLDLKISQHFGWHIQQRVQEKIKREHYGELLVGQATIVETDDFEIPFVIAAPTMRVPMALTHSVNAYLAMKAALRVVLYGVLEDGEEVRTYVRRLAVPGLGTGVGQMEPRVSAWQIRCAYDDVLYGKRGFPKSWFEAQQQHQNLYLEQNPTDLQWTKK